MNFKKSTFYILGIAFSVTIIGLLMLDASVLQDNSIVTSENAEFQKIVLSFKNYNYYPSTITVDVNKPVRIYLDSSVQGCLRSFTIPALGIAKNLQTPNDYVEFTPTEKGLYRFACAMGMGTGTVTVE